MKPESASFSLYSTNGLRKYLNATERLRLMRAAALLQADQKLFVLTLAWTGARLSEVLALTVSSIQVDPGLITIRTLKRRRHHFREVPIPPVLVKALSKHFRPKGSQPDQYYSDRRLWPWSRTTGWRVVKRAMRGAGVSGANACPKGLRHAFGVATLGRVPHNIRQKWMGHARPETTDIYSAACGPDEFAFAERFWRRPST